MCMYVDDNWCIGHRAAIDDLLEEIQKHFNITIEEGLQDYLSCEIVVSKDRKRAWLGQPHMIKKLRKTFGDEVHGMPRYKTPGTPGFGVTRPKTAEEQVSKEQHSRYRSGVGMLLFMIKHSRPDICNAVRELTKCLVGASHEAYHEMLRVIKYVLDTETLGLKVEPIVNGKNWVLTCYSDSDWAGDKDDRRSVGGMMLFLNGVLIYWRSKSQKAVALSSSEAEFYACAEVVREIPFISQILLFICVPIELPVEVEIDNVGAIFMTGNISSSSRTRHMDTRWWFVNDYQSQGLITVKFVKSEDNPSDICTKNVTGDLHEKHTKRIVSLRDDLAGLSFEPGWLITGGNYCGDVVLTSHSFPPLVFKPVSSLCLYGHVNRKGIEMAWYSTSHTGIFTDVQSTYDGVMGICPIYGDTSTSLRRSILVDDEVSSTVRSNDDLVS